MIPTKELKDRYKTVSVPEITYLCEVFIEKPHVIETHGNFFRSFKDASKFKNKFLTKKFNGRRLYGYISKINQNQIDSTLDILADSCNFGFYKPGTVLEIFEVKK
jgi:hypothetical protein